eukprot:scaffold25219_cov104-Skeletonema_dohrnii-CCMP3373.AAC.3
MHQGNQAREYIENGCRICHIPWPEQKKEKNKVAFHIIVVIHGDPTPCVEAQSMRLHTTEQNTSPNGRLLQSE